MLAKVIARAATHARLATLSISGGEDKVGAPAADELRRFDTVIPTEAMLGEAPPLPDDASAEQAIAEGEQQAEAAALMLAEATAELLGIDPHALPDDLEVHVISSNTHVLVEFYAPWCGACQQFAGNFSALATQMKQVTKQQSERDQRHIEIDFTGRRMLICICHNQQTLLFLKLF